MSAQKERQRGVEKGEGHAQTHAVHIKDSEATHVHTRTHTYTPQMASGLSQSIGKDFELGEHVPLPHCGLSAGDTNTGCNTQ